MKVSFLLKASFVTVALVVSTLSLTSCQRRTHSNLVKESYVHKYGLPVTKNEWEKQGEDGQVVQVLKDGTTVSRSYQKGVLHGPVTQTFPLSSTIQTIEQYNMGELVSTMDHYFTGVPQQEIKYCSGSMIQKTCWYEDGVPSLIENYENRLLKSGEYLTTLNAIESRVQEGQGIRLIRGSDGVLLSKDLIQNGQLIERVTYFLNGEPSSITAYEDGQLHGQKLTFLPGGLPNSMEEWVYGKQEGTTVLYQNGEKIAEVPYVNGKKQGIERRFRDGSEIIEEITWVNDFQHGPCKITVDGMEKIDWYHQGEQVSRSTYERMNIR